MKKIINLLDNKPNQPSKFRTKNWAEINDGASETYSTNNQIKFKTKVLQLSLCDYSDAYICVKGTISVTNTVVADANANNGNIKVIVKKLCSIYLLHKPNIQYTSKQCYRH